MFRLIKFVLLGFVSGCAMLPMGVMHQTAIEGESVTYMMSPSEAPTVVFEAGLGSNATVWSDVYGDVEEFAGVFAYNRPGYASGFRAVELDGERTAAESARLLRQVLAKSRVPAPYILVGHSIGGLYVLKFADMYPELVAGLVLVDARLPGFTEECIEAAVGPCLPPKSAALLAPPHVAAELRGIRASEAGAPSAEDLGEVPAVLLAATKPPPGASDATQPIWLGVQKDYADAMINGRLMIAEGSGHFIQNDAPQYVIEAIRSLVTGPAVPLSVSRKTEGL